MKTKICTRCGKEKELKEFTKNKTGKFGVRADCKECQKKYNIKYRKLNKNNIKKFNKKYQEEHKEEISKYNKRYRLLKLQENSNYDKECRHKNYKYRLKYDRKYKILNKEKMNKQSNKYKKIKRKNSPTFRLLCNTRIRINKALIKHTKSLSTMFLIGCEIDYLMYYLQEQFTKGMSWDNYGDWHVDHIKPCAKFDLSKPEEQRDCFHYTNLQPLWAKDNLKKSNN